MNQALGGGQAAVALVPLLVVAGAAFYLHAQYRRYGRPRGWPGLYTLAALGAGAGLAAYAVWPLPASVEGLCADASGRNGLASSVPPSPEWAVAPLILFLAVGFLARHRFRRGPAVTLAVAAALALAVVVVRATGVLGLYPCAYAEAPIALVVLGPAVALIGWLLARWALPTRLGGPARGWPAAVPDHGVPGPARRLAGALLDLGLWTFGAATLAAPPRLGGVVGTEGPAVALLGLVLVTAVVLPQVRRDRATPGGAAVRLALGVPGLPRPAPRWRVLVRTCLLQVPVAVLLALDLPWIALAVVAVHASSALVRSDRAGVADLVCGVRVCARPSLEGGLPSRLVRYREPRQGPLPAASALSPTPGSPAADP